MTTETIPDDIAATLDEHISWVEAVIADAEHRGAPAIQEAVNNLEAEQLPEMLFILLSAAVGDRQWMCEAIRDQVAHEQFGRLGDRRRDQGLMPDPPAGEPRLRKPSETSRSAVRS